MTSIIKELEISPQEGQLLLSNPSIREFLQNPFSRNRLIFLDEFGKYWRNDLISKQVSLETLKKIEDLAKRVDNTLYLLIPSEWMEPSLNSKHSMRYMVFHKNELSGNFYYRKIQVPIASIKPFLSSSQMTELNHKCFGDEDEILVAPLEIFIALAEGTPNEVGGHQDNIPLRNLCNEFLKLREKSGAYDVVDFHSHPLIHRGISTTQGTEYRVESYQNHFSPADIESNRKMQAIYPQIRALLLTPTQLLYWPQETTRLIYAPMDKIQKIDAKFPSRRKATIEFFQNHSARFGVQNVLGHIHDP